MQVDLFSLECECGCAAKVPADRLAGILKDADLPTNPNLLVGVDTLDDAGIYRISEDRCLVQTVDFFPPVARDPYTYGEIAAANSLSDVYAMGGEPLTAMAMVCFPAGRFGPEVLEQIMKGAVDKIREAGMVLVGGHSIVDQQPKFGLAVTGSVHPDEILDNAGARPGDVLVLTKPLGTGITIMAAKGGIASKEQEEAANRSMATLNRDAAAMARECGATACTDVTGFGFLGHAMQMAKASEVTLEMRMDAVPSLDGVLEFASMGLLAGAAYSNRQYAENSVEFADDITLAEQDLLFDPQTSGGLFFSCPADRAQGSGYAVVGEVKGCDGEFSIRVTR
jgi:selenide,water dikinase